METIKETEPTRYVCYVCNGKNPKCKDHPNCYLNGGDCTHTFQAEYALEVGINGQTYILVDGRYEDDN